MVKVHTISSLVALNAVKCGTLNGCNYRADRLVKVMLGNLGVLKVKDRLA